MTTAELLDLIDVTACKYQLPGDLCASLVWEESKGVYWATRFEEKWFAAKMLLLPTSRLAGYVPSSGTPSIYDEKIWRAHSWGLCQVMGDRARVMGFRGEFLPELISRPELSLDYGFRYLRQCFGSTPPALIPAAPIDHESPFGFTMRHLDEDFARAADALFRYNGSRAYPTRIFKHLLGKTYLPMIGLGGQKL